MSTEAAAAAASAVESSTAAAADKSAEPNAAAAEDAKNLLAELETEAGVKGDKTEPKPEKEETQQTENNKTNGASDSKPERDSSHRGRGRGSGGGGRGGGRGGRSGGGRPNYKENIKSDLTAQKESSDPVEIRKQVEFYFSDGNLPYDKFLLSAVGGSKNKPVELATIHSFKRMRHFQPFSAIVSALKESTLLELTDNDTCVRRKEPLPAEFDNGPAPNAVRIFEDRAMPRCVYAKGFGEEVPSTQFDIEAFFAPYGPTNAVRLRRTEDKLFKGSVFVEFATEDLAQAFLALDPKPLFQGKELQIMSKKEYCDKKVQDIKDGKIKANKPRDKSSGNHERGGRGDRRGGARSGRDRDRDHQDRKNGFRGGDNNNNNKRRNQGVGDAGKERESSKVETDKS
ncbi:hypothetical protein DV738_g3089, partial [Chaetothyriales sp. CBS 135597]